MRRRTPLSLSLSSSTTHDGNIKIKIKERRQDIPDHLLDDHNLTVWRTTGEMTLKANDHGWLNTLKKIDVNGGNTLQRLAEGGRP
jgi:hypothetical protein